MRITVDGLEVEVRSGTEADVPLLLSFIHGLAAVERLSVSATEESLRDALFGARPAAHTLFVFADGKPVGYIVYYFTFSTNVGKRGLWLEDLYVEEAYRRRGIGHALMTHLAGIALSNGCARFEWVVLDWNTPAVEFYRKLGATLFPDWTICRLDGASLSRVAAGEIKSEQT